MKFIFIFLLSLSAYAKPGVYYLPDVGLKALDSPSGNLQYYGGPVISNVKIVSVFWGAGVDSDVQNNIGNFYSALTNSSFMDWFSEYNTNVTAINGRAGTNQSIGRGSFIGNFTI